MDPMASFYFFALHFHPYKKMAEVGIHGAFDSRGFPHTQGIVRDGFKPSIDRLLFGIKAVTCYCQEDIKEKHQILRLRVHVPDESLGQVVPVLFLSRYRPKKFVLVPLPKPLPYSSK